MRFSLARRPAMSTDESMVRCRLKGTLWMTSLSASIFEKSRMSFTMESRLSDDALTVLTRSRCSRESGVDSSSCVTPIMPFSGVLISCDMVARKRLFSAVAASASCAAAVASASASRRRTSSLMSLWMPT